MRFGTKERVTNLGRFTSDKCRSCRSGKFHMDKKVRYLIVFGIRTIPVRTRYCSVCERCGAEEPVGTRTARYLARRHFRRAQLRHQLSMALRTLIVTAIVAALVILPFAIEVPLSRDPEVLKSLVSADGDYAIKNGDDELLAIINVEGGVKTITWYDKVSELTDTGSRGGKFYLHEGYMEATDSAGNTIMIRDQDNPGQLLDQHGLLIRRYYYDEETDSLIHYSGVDDLSAIQYTSRKVTYPMAYINEYGEKQQYLSVLYLMHNARLKAQFIMSASTGKYDRLVLISIETLSGSRVTDQADYYFDDATIAAAAQAGLTQDSVAQDFADFITVNGLEPSYTNRYEYYGNTRVASSETKSGRDSYGDMQTITTSFIVTPKRGYYILQFADSTSGAN